MQRKRIARSIAGISMPGSAFGYIPTPDEGEGGGDGGDKGGDGGKSGDGDKGEPKTFTQEQVNSMLAKERRDTEGRFADYDDLKAKATKHDEDAENAKSENQKAIDAARKEGRDEATQAGNARLIAAEARALAAEAKFANPALAVRALDLKGVKVNDDGEPDSAAIKALLKELADTGAFVIEDGTGKKGPKPDKAQGGASGKGDASVSAGRDMYAARHGKKSA